MIPLFSKCNPIQESDLQDYQVALQNTQGNILKSHGRQYTINAFLSFGHDQALLKTAVRALSALVTSADTQMRQTRDHRLNGIESLFAGFGLSASGYSALGYDPARFPSAAFRGGMARADSGLGDRPVSTWEPKFQAKLDAMILLAHADPVALQTSLATFTAPFQGLADVSVEYGIANYKGPETIEHFGFVDGVSQPLFFQSEVGAPAANWDPGAGPKLALIKDPFGNSEDDCGSYFVFRKLRQDVAGFNQRVSDLQKQLAAGQDPNLAGALVVGRFADGTSVALHNSPTGLIENDFIYKGTIEGSGADPNDQRCPISAHIRKVNPRGGTDDIDTERNRRIARRGITYGIQGQDPEVGLLFQCCQSSLEDQFEFVQGSWSNTAGQPPSTGIDPVAGESTGSNQTWPSTWGTFSKVMFDFGGFVTLRGGGYFFLPSITFLRNA